MLLFLNKKQSEFYNIVKDLIHSKQVQDMNNIHHHVPGVSCLDHSIFVAYISYRIAKRFNLDYISVARGALLHDMHLQDWHETNSTHRLVRLVVHPAIAAQNAKDYFEINKIEEEIIVTHMWPVTITKLPKKPEAIVVNLSDKLCAIYEFSRLYTKSKTKKQLNNFNACYAQIDDADYINTSIAAD